MFIAEANKLIESSPEEYLGNSVENTMDLINFNLFIDKNTLTWEILNHQWYITNPVYSLKNLSRVKNKHNSELAKDLLITIKDSYKIYRIDTLLSNHFKKLIFMKNSKIKNGSLIDFEFYKKNKSSCIFNEEINFDKKIPLKVKYLLVDLKNSFKEIKPKYYNFLNYTTKLDLLPGKIIDIHDEYRKEFIKAVEKQISILNSIDKEKEKNLLMEHIERKKEYLNNILGVEKANEILTKKYGENYKENAFENIYNFTLETNQKILELLK